MQNTMTQENSNSGFTLPELSDSRPDSYEQTTQTVKESYFPALPIADTQTRDTALGVGVILVLMVMYAFIKDAFSRALIRKRFSPAAADRAAFWLFGLLTFTTIMIFMFILFPAVFVVPERIVAMISLPILCLVMVVQSSRGSHRR